MLHYGVVNRHQNISLAKRHLLLLDVAPCLCCIFLACREKSFGVRLLVHHRHGGHSQSRPDTTSSLACVGVVGLQEPRSQSVSNKGAGYDSASAERQLSSPWNCGDTSSFILSMLGWPHGDYYRYNIACCQELNTSSTFARRTWFLVAVLCRLAPLVSPGLFHVSGSAWKSSCPTISNEATASQRTLSHCFLSGKFQPRLHDSDFFCPILFSDWL